MFAARAIGPLSALDPAESQELVAQGMGITPFLPMAWWHGSVNATLLQVGTPHYFDEVAAARGNAEHHDHREGMQDAVRKAIASWTSSPPSPPSRRRGNACPHDPQRQVLGMRTTARRYQRMLTSLRAADLLAVEPDLKKLTVPTLVVWGTGDVFFPVRWAYWLRDTIPSVTKVVELSGARLFFPDERASDLAAELRRHWAAHPAAPAGTRGNTGRQSRR